MVAREEVLVRSFVLFCFPFLPAIHEGEASKQERDNERKSRQTSQDKIKQSAKRQTIKQEGTICVSESSSSCLFASPCISSRADVVRSSSYVRQDKNEKQRGKKGEKRKIDLVFL